MSGQLALAVFTKIIKMRGLTQKSAKKRTFGVSPLWFLYILPNGTKFRLCSPPHLRHQGQLLVPSGFFEKIVGSTNQPP
ncbi:hypothetical protein P9213_03385, partial [Geobacillus stearothermophilus]|uniref:hypothetical protein n=1 Tax=Geobacillus stearothermophilus TaxID=1422 RepID=UPI002E1B9010|nr:hypothetical protein [Geobacillus stearothermophilus]